MESRAGAGGGRGGREVDGEYRHRVGVGAHLCHRPLVAAGCIDPCSPRDQPQFRARPDPRLARQRGAGTGRPAADPARGGNGNQPASSVGHSPLQSRAAGVPASHGRRGRQPRHPPDHRGTSLRRDGSLFRRSPGIACAHYRGLSRPLREAGCGDCAGVA
ncbi:hypothetical protein D3C79_828340 [compost metagenome]